MKIISRIRYPYFLILLLIFWTGFIWSNSLPSIEESREQSHKVEELVKPVLDVIQVPQGSREHVVRKTAHLVEFFVLGILWALLFQGKNLQWCGLSCLTTAMMDEGLQSLTGRGNQLSDVLLDFCGSVAAILIVGFLIRCWNQKKKDSQTVLPGKIV